MQAPFKKPLEIIKRLEQNGYEAYFVGGSVRDLLLKRPIGDIDIATSARPEIIMNLFERTIDVGVEHGTVVVLLDGMPYEVTTFRHESEYLDFRHPKEVTFISSLEEDLKRRDFSMNAIAMSASGEIFDPFCGQKAIEEKRIQTVGNPDDRFREDALRMMRALRFVSQLNFSLSNSTYHAIAQNRQLLENISVERITIEFIKLLKGENAQRAINLLYDTKLYCLLPGLEQKGEQFSTFSEFDLSFLTEESEYWTLLLFQINEIENVTTFLQKWKLPNKIIKDVTINVQFLSKKLSCNEDWTAMLVYLAGLPNAIQVEKVYRVFKKQDPNQYIGDVKDLYEKLPIKSRADLVVNGHDLITWVGKKGGPWLKICLTEIEHLVIQHKLLNNKKSIKEWLLSCNLK